MPKKKEKKTFFKIKERLVLLPPKNFFGRKVIGIFCLIFGSLTITISFLYFYLIPNFFSPRDKPAIKEEKLEFAPERILIPFLGLDFSVEGNLIDAKPPLKNFEVEKGEEIVVLGKGIYKDFLVKQVLVQESSSSSKLELLDNNLKLILQTRVKPPKTLIIEAELVNEKQP